MLARDYTRVAAKLNGCCVVTKPNRQGSRRNISPAAIKKPGTCLARGGGEKEADRSRRPAVSTSQSGRPWIKVVRPRHPAAARHRSSPEATSQRQDRRWRQERKQKKKRNLLAPPVLPHSRRLHAVAITGESQSSTNLQHFVSVCRFSFLRLKNKQEKKSGGTDW